MSVAQGSLRCLNMLVDAFHQIWGILGPPFFLWVSCPPACLFLTSGAPDGYVWIRLRCLERPFPAPVRWTLCWPAFESIGPAFCCVQFPVKLTRSVRGFHLNLRLWVRWGWGGGIMTNSGFKSLQASLYALFLCESILEGPPFVWGREGQSGGLRGWISRFPPAPGA